YMRTLPPARVAAEAAPYFVRAGLVAEATDPALAYIEALLPMVGGSIDRIEEMPERTGFLFAWDASTARALVESEPEGIRAVAALAEAAARIGPLVDRETFRAAVAQARAASSLKGRALLHPARAALT